MTAEILSEHYQKTFELTLKLWEQRNRTFLILLFAVGIGAILTFNVDQAEPLLVDFVAKVFEIKEQDRLSDLRSSFPYSVIQSVILMVILYLMVQLYHRTININRNYLYLAGLESEIREELSLDKDSISFTREGTFYWNESPSFSQQIGVAYILMLGLLLFAFVGMRLFLDISQMNFFSIIADVILGIVTILFFLKYASSSSRTIKNLFQFKKKNQE